MLKCLSGLYLHYFTSGLLLFGNHFDESYDSLQLVIHNITLGMPIILFVNTRIPNGRHLRRLNTRTRGVRRRGVS